MGDTDSGYGLTNHHYENYTMSAITTYKQPSVEVTVLVLMIIVGVIGNAFVIGAVLVEKTLRNMGVAFIINLAVADLVINAWYLPQVLANVINNYRNSLEHNRWFCYVTGFMVSWCCQVSVMTLMFIAFSRYWKLTRNASYNKWFGKKRTLFMIAFIWIESFLVALPLIVGWKDSGILLGFDKDIVSCMWNDSLSSEYNVFLVIVAIFLPLIATIYFYIQIYRHIKKTKLPPKKEVSPSALRKTYETNKEKMKINTAGETELSSSNIDSTRAGSVRTHHARNNSLNSHKTAGKRRAEERERSFVLTLVVVVVFFLLFWTPYAIVVLISSDVSPLAKRTCGWLALSNSAINSIIYGVLNLHFRRGYVKFLEHVWSSITACCCCEKKMQSWTNCLRSERKWEDGSSGNELKHHSVTFN